MHADIQPLYRSDTLTVLDFHCLEDARTGPCDEFTALYAISFVRKGNFVYTAEGKSYHLHTETILHENPDTPYAVEHPHSGRDVCTIVAMNRPVIADIRSHFWRKDTYAGKPANREEIIFPVTVSPASPRLSYLHNQLLHLAGKPAEKRLHVDTIAIDLASEVMGSLYNSRSPRREIAVNHRHLETIERAKEFILQRFNEDISLSEIARSACLSEFHFLRVFRSVTSTTPYRYLLAVRLNHALQLARNTDMSSTEICFSCGFNDVSNFVASFRNYFGFTPSKAGLRSGPYCSHSALTSPRA